MGFNSLVMLLALVVVLFLSNKNFYGAEGRKSLSKEEDLELERQLKILNKPPIKTFVTKYGDIFDCIDIHKQPSFDHPLLKNHKIEMNPKLITDKTINKAASSIIKASKIDQSKFKNETCPTGTVPIRRTKKQDIVTAKYFSEQNGIPQMKLHYLSVKPVPPEGTTRTYHGGSGHISIQTPHTYPKGHQFVTSQMWLQNGPAGEVDSIEFGWASWPELFADFRPRTFGYYTNDGYKTGCFNIVCLGFMQIHPNISLGGDVFKAVIWESEGRQYELQATIEPSEDDNWWLSFGDERIGYWPSELFQYLSNKNASAVRYGAKTGQAIDESTPSLGEWQSVREVDIMKACYISEMKILDLNAGLIDFDVNSVAEYQDDKSQDCYSLLFPGDLTGLQGGNMGIGMMFGGPGGAC